MRLITFLIIALLFIGDVGAAPVYQSGLGVFPAGNNVPAPSLPPDEYCPDEPTAAIAAYWTAAEKWNGHLFDKQSSLTAPSGDGTGLLNTYYDGQLGAYKLADHFDDTETYYAYADQADYWYGERYVEAYGGSASGYWTFAEGFAERYLRRGDTNARNNIQLLLEHASYVPFGDTSDDTLSRENAYALITHIQAERVGITLNETQLARRTTLYNNALGIIDQWTTGAADYFRPFMGSLTAKALIEYYENVSPDAIIIPKLEALAALIQSTCWDADASSWRYTNRELYGNHSDTCGTALKPDCDLKLAPDLNMLISPIFAWLWKHTGVGEYHEIFDAALAAGVPVYNPATGQHVSGAWQGTWQIGAYSLAPEGKMIDQQTFWGPEGIANRLSRTCGTAPGATPTATPTPTPTATATATPTATPAGFDASDYGTDIIWWDGTDPASVLDASDTSASDTENVKTVMDKGSLAINLVQDTDANRMSVAANSLNGFQTLTSQNADGFNLTGAQGGDISKDRTGLTIVFVGRITDGSSTNRLLKLSDNSTGNRVFIAALSPNRDIQTSVKPQDGGTAADSYQNAGTFPALDTWYVWTFRWDFAGDTYEMYQNGTLVDSLASINSSGSSSNTASSSGDQNPFSGNAYGNYGWKGGIAQFIVYDGALTTTNRQNVQTALCTQYGITCS